MVGVYADKEHPGVPTSFTVKVTIAMQLADVYRADVEDKMSRSDGLRAMCHLQYRGIAARPFMFELKTQYQFEETYAIPKEFAGYVKRVSAKPAR